MKVFFLNTASFFIHLAIIKDNEILYQCQEKNDSQLSEKIFNLIEKTFKEANTKPNEIKKIYVVNGPGSFTGIRLGITIAKTFAWHQQIPICEISTIAFLASGQQETVGIVIPDKQGMGYCGIYTKNLEKKQESYTNIEEFKKNNLPIINYQEEIPIDLLKIIKKYQDQQTNVHQIKANYLKKLAVEKEEK